MSKAQGFKDLLQAGVDATATAVEETHQAIAAVPFEAAERVPGLAPGARTLKEVQRRWLGGIYGSVRAVNRTVGYVADRVIRGVEAYRAAQAPPASPAADTSTRTLPTPNGAPGPTSP